MTENARKDDRNFDTAPAAGGHDPNRHNEMRHYEIRVEGRLGHRWSAWFDGLDVSAADDGITIISGPIADDSALHGLLRKLRDIGVPLLSLTQLPATTPDTIERP